MTDGRTAELSERANEAADHISIWTTIHRTTKRPDHWPLTTDHDQRETRDWLPCNTRRRWMRRKLTRFSKRNDRLVLTSINLVRYCISMEALQVASNQSHNIGLDCTVSLPCSGSGSGSGSDWFDSWDGRRARTRQYYHNSHQCV